MIVSNASPLIALARIGSLHLLPALFERVAIPEAVWSEVVVQGEGKPGARDVANAPWIDRLSVQQPLPPPYGRLQAGEREAIALATEARAEALIMDEGPGRQRAQAAGILCLGTLDVLLRACRRGIIPDAEPLILKLDEVGFRMSPAVRDRALTLARQLRDSSQGR